MKKLKSTIIGLVAVATACCMLSFTACDDAGSEAEAAITNAITATRAANYRSAQISANIGCEYSSSYSEDYTISSSMSAALDFDTFNFDLCATVSMDDESFSGYMFARDGYLFEYGSEDTSDITSKTELTAYDSFEIGDVLSISEEYMQILQTMPFAVASLAANYDAVSATSTTITVNVGKFINSLYGDFVTVISSITETTTVSDLLEYDLVENLIDAVSVGMDASEVMSLFGVDADAVGISAPAEGDSLYEYICSIAEGTFGSIKVTDYFEGLDEIKEQLADMTVSYSNDVFTISSENVGISTYSGGVSISGDLIYTLNSDSSLKSIALDCEFSVSSLYAGSDVVYSDTVVSCDIEAKIEFSTSAASLKDIYSNNVFDTDMTVKEYIENKAESAQ